jgi:integrase
VKRVVIANPLQVKAIAHARVKTDKVDAGTRASLFAAGYLPEIWTPDSATERKRRLTARRYQLVRHRTRIKNGLINDYLDAAGHGTDESGPLFRPVKNNTTGRLDTAITADGSYKLVRSYSAQLGFEIGAHALRATAATNALDHQADIAKVQEWLGHANIATTRIYDHRRTRPEDSPTLKVAY